ncbi:DUF4097 family beta strand repeat-containing protein [Amphibacillus sp. Q70]|uniref:DUF4097 family beta strand repeat-containing protein n=1 Tax=Amphibacillus sp. Q70 TaxID=3453416 RepID=UPI003F85A7EE
MKRIGLSLIFIGLFITTSCGEGTDHYEMNESYQLDSIKELIISSESWNIEFQKSDSEELKVFAEGKQQDVEDTVALTKDQQRLEIRQKEASDKGFLAGFTFGKKGTISIHIPESVINNIKLTNKNGDIEMNDIIVNYLEVQNTSGDSQINRVFVDTGKWESTDGTISIEESSFQQLNTSSKSGDFYLKKVSSDHTEIASLDGSVSIQALQKEGDLTVETESGDINVAYQETPTSSIVIANSEASDISLQFQELQLEEDTKNLKKGTLGEGVNQLILSSKTGAIQATD